MKKITLITLLFTAVFFHPKNVLSQTDFNDVASIFYANCTSCHNSDGIGNFPMTSYENIEPFSAIIADAVSSGQMPPWLPDSTYRKFLHSRALTTSDKDAILQWVADGALKGDASLHPVAPTFAATAHPRKLTGKADLVVGIGTYESNAGVDGVDDNPYNCFVVDLGLTEGKWLRAAEIRPGNYSIVHHVVAKVDTTGTAVTDLSGSCGTTEGFGFVGWSSGAAPLVYPNKAPFKAGQYFPAGSKLVIQMHYAPGSAGEIDSTKVRLFFYDDDEIDDIRLIRSNVLLQNWLFNIPANSVRNISGEQGAFSGSGFVFQPPSDGYTIYAINPHSHFVCTEIVNYANLGTDTIPLIRINNWDYGWQGYYYVDTLIKIPANYKLKAVHKFDNTSNNDKLETEPNNAVKAGKATEDEMLFDAFLWTEYKEGDENIDIAQLLVGDAIYATGAEEQVYETTLISGINNIEEELVLTDIYPNPASNSITIELSEAANNQVTLTNITGQVVYESSMLNSQNSIDVSQLPSGVYVLKIINIDSNYFTASKIAITH